MREKYIMKNHKPLLIIGLLLTITMVVACIYFVTREDVPEDVMQVIVGEKTYTVDISGLDYQYVNGTRVNGKGEEKEVRAQGVLVKDILAELEITGFESISIVADDAYHVEISKDEVYNDTKVYLIQEEREERLRLVVFGDKDSKRSVSNVAQILVEQIAESDKKSVTFTDDLGREVTVENPQRVAALLGSFADMWILAGGEVIASADDAWEDFGLELPENAVNLGQTKELNLEKLFEAEPDFILASTNTNIDMEWKDVLENSQIPTAYFEVSDFEDYLRVFKICTEITGRSDLYEQNGIKVKKQVDSTIEMAEERVRENGAAEVLFLRASAAKVRAKNSKDSVLGEMLSKLQCINIADSEESLLENLSVEYILQEDPDFIFLVEVGNDKDGIKRNMDQFIRDNPIWQELTAVKEGRVYTLDKSLYNLKPNDRWGEAYEELEYILSQKQK